MTVRRRSVLAAAAVPLAAPAIARAQESTQSLRDLARRATIYLFPVYEMYRTRWRATVDEANPQRQRLNRFRHLPELADHRARLVTTPNHDTLYSSAWLDLSLEPLFLTVPTVGDLYYSYAFLDLFTNNFAYVSHRLYGGRPPPHMIVGPAWNGDAPSEVKLIRAPGHTPGSQFMVVKLPKSGTAILTSDVVYLTESLDKNLIPPIPGTWNPGDAYRSYDRIRHIRDVENAKMFIGHDPELFKAAKKAPEFYD